MGRTMSWTQAGTIAQCPRQWHHRYILNDVEQPVSPQMAFGSMVHSAVEQFFLSGMAGQTKNVDHRMKMSVQYAWENRPLKLIDWTENHLRQLFLAMYSLEEVFKLKKIQVPNRMALERKMRLDFSSGWGLVGVADMVAVEKGDLVLSDFKTGRIKNRQNAQSDQVAFYAWMWSQINGNKPVDAVSVVYLGVPWERHTYDSFEFLQKVAINKVENAIEIADRIIAGEEPEFTTSALCGWCPAVGVCEEGKKVALKRIKSGKSVSDQTLEILKEEI